METYGQVRLRTEQNITGSWLTVPNPPAHNTNKTDLEFIPFGLFSKAIMYLNDKIMSTVTEISTSDTLIRSAFESKSIMKSTDCANSINPMSIQDTILPQKLLNLMDSHQKQG